MNSQINTRCSKSSPKCHGLKDLSRKLSRSVDYPNSSRMRQGTSCRHFLGQGSGPFRSRYLPLNSLDGIVTESLAQVDASVQSRTVFPLSSSVSDSFVHPHSRRLRSVRVCWTIILRDVSTFPRPPSTLLPWVFVTVFHVSSFPLGLYSVLVSTRENKVLSPVVR